MKVFQAERHFQTTGGLHVTDITDEVATIVGESGVVDGICCVYSPHTTCCVRVNEYERGMFEDFGVLLRRLIPHETYYAHDDWDRRTENICPEDMEIGNGHARSEERREGKSVDLGGRRIIKKKKKKKKMKRNKQRKKKKKTKTKNKQKKN